MLLLCNAATPALGTSSHGSPHPGELAFPPSLEFPGLSYERTGAIRLYGGNSSPVIGVGWRGFCCAQHVVSLITQVLVDAVGALPRSRASIGFRACPIKIV